MSSILTNNSAMVALQTLKATNKNLAHTQNAISTGKDIASAKDNSAIWAISKVMESDVTGFKAVADSLALGESTVAVASAGAEQITNLLTEIKEKVVAATGENVDRGKLNTEVTALKEQIGSIISASQFNGMNLLNTAGNAGMNVLSSIDRDNAGDVTGANIAVASVDFEANLDIDYRRDNGRDPDRRHRGAYPDRDQRRGCAGCFVQADFGPVRVRGQGDGRDEVRHRFAGGRGHGSDLGASSGPADPAAAGRSGPVDRQPGAADHHAALPLMIMAEARSRAPLLPLTS